MASNPVPAASYDLENWRISQSDKYQDTQKELNKEFCKAIDKVSLRDNPKDAIGSRKAPMSYVPVEVLTELGLAMMEGGVKYGPFNWREAGVRSSVYIDALNRHVFAYQSGENTDPGSKELQLHHLIKGIASLTVLYDAILHDKCIDDRPPKSFPGWQEGANSRAKAFLDKREASNVKHTDTPNQ